MRLNKTEQTFCGVARFAEETGITFRQAVELRSLCLKAFRAGEYALNVSHKAAAEREIVAGEKVKQYAEPLGFKVSWPGLWPVFEKDGRFCDMPA